ncbi:DUF262 domain-containing protein [Pseudomonas putida]|uniref:DUF262 domain-containing protein n=1 Tax=Pseudomonas putida TaxID=303 RepID=UPI0023639168|nr:DUF262 domain-containing protein [Pseudomonas putida]MDD2139805.1 DUF262 domain-containing protein [Pseudomonas putida]HDS1721729.1 DUF262 domain-containing protein [Pseudomonas putida]
MARELSDFELELVKLVNPLAAARWSADYRWDNVERSLAGLGEDYEGLELCPDFQRGHVWQPSQQVHFVENCLRGIVPSSGLLLQFNCPGFSEQTNFETDLPPGLQCVDGLQRYTALCAFVKGEVKPFGLSAEQLKGTQFAPNRFHVKIAIHGFTKRADLLNHYLSINSGGTPHSADELDRVRALLAETQANKN